MKAKGAHRAAQSQLIRRGGLIGTKRLKRGKWMVLFRHFALRIVSLRVGGIGESRDHIDGGRNPDSTSFESCQFKAGSPTIEWDVSPVLVDFPIRANASPSDFHLSEYLEVAVANPAVGSIPSYILEVGITASDDPLRMLVYATDEWVTETLPTRVGCIDPDQELAHSYSPDIEILFPRSPSLYT